MSDEIILEHYDDDSVLHVPSREDPHDDLVCRFAGHDPVPLATWPIAGWDSFACARCLVPLGTFPDKMMLDAAGGFARAGIPVSRKNPLYLAQKKFREQTAYGRRLP